MNRRTSCLMLLLVVASASSMRGADEAARPSPDGHWAFLPVREPAVPNVRDESWVRTPIDAFVLARLEAAGLAPSPSADARTLVRRASYGLLGLPPDAGTIEAFAADDRTDAWTRLVDRLLESPRYGEHQARQWLDVARYSDTKGYVYGREERNWVHAWSYRDWVVDAFDRDMPYDRFLLLQIAADQVDDRAPGDLAAMGFLTLGRRFLGVSREIIDDRIDVTTRGTMALTVGCARCHDHKYDPISSADYYALYGVFDGSAEWLERLPADAPRDDAFEEEFARRQGELAEKLAAYRREAADRVRARLDEYLRAQTRLGDFPAEGFDQILQPSDLIPGFVRRWEEFLRRTRADGDRVFAAWHAYAGIPRAEFAARSDVVTHRLAASSPVAVHPTIAFAFRDPPASFDEVIDRYVRVFRDIEAAWELAIGTNLDGGVPAGLSDPDAEELRRVLFGPGAPCEVPDEPIANCEDLFDSGRVTELWNLQGAVDRSILGAQQGVPCALVLRDRQEPARPRIFRRGNSTDPGDEVPLRFLDVLGGAPFRRGNGRLELARAIASPSNPLTARVIVNRVWAHHFGRGFVTTPSDFGLRASPPSHPDLLDWLAARFVAEGWSLKALHRSILLSSTYRQASVVSVEESARARRIDPDGSLLWRHSARRLSFEELRDSMFAAVGDLDRSVGGRPFDLFALPDANRRTLYGRIDRQFFPSVLRTFDCANPDLHIPARRETTVPQQALFLMNHPLVLDRARALAGLVRDGESAEDGVRRLFVRTLQREPDARELEESVALVREATPIDEGSRGAADWLYGYGGYVADGERVAEFTPLPHFTGAAWQGGPNWPDDALGWVQLTATGGHPGNDLAHAAIRRWTAPRAMSVTITGRIAHEPRPGDGICARVVSSRAGLLSSVRPHHEAVDMEPIEIEVAVGETVDFVVDIGGTLSHDQFLWDVTIEAVEGADAEPRTWNARADFTSDRAARLDGWGQLAQLLLFTNEFVFVD